MHVHTLHIVHSGSTPLGMYKKLIEFYKAKKLSFEYVKTFNMDEYVGLASDHPESYHYYMYENFFKHIDINPGMLFVLSRTNWFLSTKNIIIKGILS